MTGPRSLLHGFAALSAVALVACSASDSSPEAEIGGEPPQMPAAGSAMEAAPAGPEAAGLTDPNLVDEALLTQLPHITAEIAADLIAARPFGDMLEVDMILAESLDGAQREEVYSHLFARLDLNSATEAEILLIPGVGDRMAHEFEEYRPYVGIEQFRREIGKYVDEDEVARLEQYVRIE